MRQSMPPACKGRLTAGLPIFAKAQNQRGGWEEFCGSIMRTVGLVHAGTLECGRPQGRSGDGFARCGICGRCEPGETYSVSLQTLVYCQTWRRGRSTANPHQCRSGWSANQRLTGTSRDRIGSWDYGSGRGSGDPSNAQFAILALGAAQDRGIDVDPAVFARSLEYWVNRQRGGCWSYGIRS